MNGCQNMTENATDAPDKEVWSRLYEYLDSSGGLFTTLFNALYAARERGLRYETPEDILTDVDICLNRAFEMLDEEGLDVDPNAVLHEIETARTTMNKFIRSLGDELYDYTPPQHIDLGVYDSFGEFAGYVHSDIIAMEKIAKEL